MHTHVLKDSKHSGIIIATLVLTPDFYYLGVKRMALGDAESISGIANSLIITKTQKVKMATNPDKTIQNMHNSLSAYL